MRNIRNHLFVCLRLIFTVFYTGRFQVPPERNRPHRKWRFPPKIPIWPKSLLYKPSEKCFKTPHHSRMGANYERYIYQMHTWCYVSNISKIMVYYPALSFEKELLENKYRQYTLFTTISTWIIFSIKQRYIYHMHTWCYVLTISKIMVDKIF